MNRTFEHEREQYEKIHKAANFNIYASDLLNVRDAAIQKEEERMKNAGAIDYQRVLYAAIDYGIMYGASIGYRAGVRHEKKAAKKRKQLKMDYFKLRGRIREVCGTEAEFAERMGISQASLDAKLSSRTGFKNSEIKKACELLSIDIKDAGMYFLCIKS